jgi:hypothetical protein
VAHSIPLEETDAVSTLTVYGCWTEESVAGMLHYSTRVYDEDLESGPDWNTVWDPLEITPKLRRNRGERIYGTVAASL